MWDGFQPPHKSKLGHLEIFAMKQLQKHLAYIIPFSILISLCYMQGYWGTFCIEYYSFVTTSEIAMIAIVPMVYVGISSIAGILIGETTYDSDKYKNKFATIMYFIMKISFIIATILIMYFNPSARWLIIPPVAGLIILLLYIKSSLFNEDFWQKNKTLLFIIFLLPPESFGYGKHKAIQLINGDNFLYVVNKNVSDPKKATRYLGKIGEHIFMINPKTSAITIQNIDASLPLQLKSFAINDLTKN